jgi:hypothetical protein
MWVVRVTITEELFSLHERIYHLAHLVHHQMPIGKYDDHEPSFKVIKLAFAQVTVVGLITLAILIGQVAQQAIKLEPHFVSIPRQVKAEVAPLPFLHLFHTEVQASEQQPITTKPSTPLDLEGLIE